MFTALLAIIFEFQYTITLIGTDTTSLDHVERCKCGCAGRGRAGSCGRGRRGGSGCAGGGRQNFPVC